PAELMLVGKTVDEALAELDKTLDRAALAGKAELRVIHGHGTGRLRRAVREFLARHPHVAAHRAGGANEGGDGATIVVLR
ncbi:MAG TPA: Smr/MutS family protein, partial [Candidatus Polarisedimenticolaceae bacterium]|nr:Smr/MutS family protein [Candidatus Polarisedimenticolaceae bacterium]